jgi:hypothetical protein
MTQEEKRIKLAEVAGFTDIMLPMGFHQQMSDEKSKQCGGKWRFEIPNYFNDLNAVHELEEKLDDSQKMLYVAKLSQILSPSKFPQSFRILHATAEQRCEALGLTLNLW